MRLFLKTVDRISEFFGVVSMLLLAAAVLVVCQMILMRYVFNASTVWQTEFVVYALMAATFLGSSYVLLHRGHVGVDLLPTMIGGKGKLVLELIGGLISLAFCGVLAYSGWIYFHEALDHGYGLGTAVMDTTSAFATRHGGIVPSICGGTDPPDAGGKP